VRAAVVVAAIDLPQQKNPGENNAAGGRFLALCLTWRQYAANHHETSIINVG